jgi:hypothetical protein
MDDLAPPPAPPPARLDPDAIAARLLRGPLALALAGLCLGQFATWFPNYLTWPWWADHDVFAVAARSWDAGALPYRDVVGNNFPGTTYVFWALGRVFGWGRTAPFWAFDGLLLAGFGVLAVAWGRRVLGSALPGLAGAALWMGYYLNLDYSLAAQRDWHGPLFAVAGLMAAQAWPGRAGRVLAGLGLALGLAFRPQVILLAPAHVLAVWEFRKDASARGSIVRALAEWALAAAVGLALAFAPLAWCGLLGDFARSLGAVAYGGGYNRTGPLAIVERLVSQFQGVKLLAVPLALLALWPAGGSELRRAARPWGLAFAGVLLYRPLSPVSHAYLAHPLMLAWCALAAVLVGFVRADRRLTPSLQLVVILLILGLNVTVKPRFCNPRGSMDALAHLRLTREPGASPTGYALNPDVRAAGRYAWDDYRRVLDHLRLEVSPGARVANALAFVPAVAGPTGHLSALPAESVAWVSVVNPADEPRFAAALAGADRRTVVVWAPGETVPSGTPALEVVRAAIRDHFEPDRRFGAIEVWRRKDAAALAAGR